MPLKLNVGVSRKVDLPDFSSIGVSCSLELEVESGLIDDLEGFHGRVRDVYVAAHQAVHEELARLQAPVEVPHDPSVPPARHAADGQPGANGQAVHPPAGRSRPRSPATEKQVWAIRSIASRQHADLDRLLRDHGVDRAEDLSIRQASELIDALKSAAGT